MKRKIAITTGSRSEYGLLRPVIQAISKSQKLKPYLIVAGMHLAGKKFGSTIQEIKKDNFKIYKTVRMQPENDSNYAMAKSLGRGVISFSNIFQNLKPDINLVLGDRTEMLASAIAAYHMNIPNAHIHGGDKSQGGLDEYTRHAITKMSNIHFTATKESFNRIKKMGENPKYIFLTGSPSIDEIAKKKFTSKNELAKKYKINFSGKEIILLQHPVTTQTDLSIKQIQNILKAISSLKTTTIAIAPNYDAGYKKILEYLISHSKKYSFIHMYRNLPRSDYLGMLKNCGVLVGNSSSGIIEASYFEIPVVNIGIRQKGRETAKSVINVQVERSDYIQKAIIQALKRKKQHKIKKVSTYGSGLASMKIVKILEKIKLDKKLIQKQIFY